MSEQMSVELSNTKSKNPVTGDGYSNSLAGRLTRLKDYMTMPSVLDNFTRFGGTDGARNYVGSVLNEIRKSTGDSEKDLTKATPESIINTCIDAASMGLFIDGRKHAFLVKRWNKNIAAEEVTLQIGYPGYLARLDQQLKGFVAVVELVYTGDEFSTAQEGSKASFTHRRLNPFDIRADSDVVGAYAYLEWQEGERVVSKMTTIDKNEIAKMRKAATMSAIWNNWFGEMAKKSAIRRACKYNFAALTHDLDERDNDSFDLSKPVGPSDDTKALEAHLAAGLKGGDVAGLVTLGNDAPEPSAPDEPAPGDAEMPI